MKDLLSKEHCCYKIDTLLTKNSAYLPSMDNPPILIAPPSFLQENLDPPSMFF